MFSARKLEMYGCLLVAVGLTTQSPKGRQLVLPLGQEHSGTFPPPIDTLNIIGTFRTGRGQYNAEELWEKSRLKPKLTSDVLQADCQWMFSGTPRYTRRASHNC
ncbi:hypothetical protein J6590_059830 [Homalodisca vitripennis]|nr:hypothetical protein J6590_059830 [Homalodisca vitripennis]